MRNTPLALALLLFVGWTACAQANVPRYHFEGDSDYSRAKVSHLLGPSLLVAWVMGWTYWARAGTWRRQLLVLPLIGVPIFVFVVIELGGGGTYFIAGTRPPGAGPFLTLENLPRQSPDPQMVGFMVALAFAACCCILGVVRSLTKKRLAETSVAEKVT